ncbi:hypothetical protein PPL_00674 [Heterostelium album PN500]|uniref:Uncharacterized protein n=1 Tax=Heterostelium pallidum (strain ATCC 26659 / Pp 5 / PN500) TaxID=670386 RepID=D3AX45_HETP5|nr:hypothetical protein PPL_00674 [Heterostelium album PN500]EFA86114.1 hypothetical protein PPL_00674 [Heterostelium album PN500]|eukprot:XP_020438219.1 hypothetical protein PPL_00674 [Heterostelium album PN500]
MAGKELRKSASNKSIVKKQKLISEDTATEIATTTSTDNNNNNHNDDESSREQFLISLVFKQRYLLRLIMEKVKELSNIRGLTPVNFFVKKLIAPNTTPITLPEDYKLSGIAQVPDRPTPNYDIPPNALRYMEIDDVSWMCRNKYISLLRYKLARNEPLRLTDVNSTYKTIVTDKQLFKQLYERFPKNFTNSLIHLVKQDMTKDMLELIMNDLVPTYDNIIQILLILIKANNIELVELMLTFHIPVPKTQDLELIEYYQTNFGLAFNRNIYDKYLFNDTNNKKTSNAEAIERNEQTIAKVMEILNKKKSIIENNQRLAELERSKYGNGGVPITESDVINMNGYMIRYYPFVMLNQEPFLPETDQQLGIVQFLFEEMKDPINRQAMTTLFYAISNGLKQITNYIINNLDVSNYSYSYSYETLKCKCMCAAIQTKQFDVVDLIFEKWGKIFKENEVLNIIRTSDSFAALQLYIKHFPSVTLGSKFNCTKVGYMLDNLQAEEFGIKCDNIDKNLDFSRCGQYGLISIITAYLNYKKDKFNTSNLEAALYGAANSNQLNFLQEVHKLMPDYRFKMTTHIRGVKGRNKTTVQYFNETFKLQTEKPTKKKK